MIRIKDPRVLQILILTIFTLLGQTVLKFQVTPIQVIVTIGTCILLEWLFTYAKKEEFIVPKSAMITGLSIALLLRADTVIPFLLASIAAITTKHWLQYKGGHIFNPSNIGIVVISLLFPITVATAPLQWGFFLALIFVIATAGTYMVYKVRRFPTILSFLGGFSVAGLTRHFVWDKSFNAIFNEFMWGGLLIFTFYMITDPKTSPNSTQGQIYFGLATALLGQIMIQMEIHGALFLSLALICLGRFLWRWGMDRRSMVERGRPSLS
jgi:Na+-translocating ferredoxin:NAD+ oxidoreductase RnfD subunit